MSQELTVLISGIVASFVTAGAKWAWKSLSGVDMPSSVAAYVTYLVCVVIAILSRVLSSGDFIPSGGPEVVVPALALWFTEILGVATLTYNTLIKEESRLFARRVG